MDRTGRATASPQTAAPSPAISPRSLLSDGDASSLELNYSGRPRAKHESHRRPYRTHTHTSAAGYTVPPFPNHALSPSTRITPPVHSRRPGRNRQTGVSIDWSSTPLSVLNRTSPQNPALRTLGAIARCRCHPSPDLPPQIAGRMRPMVPHDALRVLLV